MTDRIGKSGVVYYCRCGAASNKCRDVRLMDADGWSLEYVDTEVEETFVDSKTQTRKTRTVTRSIAVFLCKACVAAKRAERAKNDPRLA